MDSSLRGLAQIATLPPQSLATIAMMITYQLLLVLLCCCIAQTSAVSWYFLRFNAPLSTTFTSFSGTLVVPPLSRPAVYYLWPGLQPRDNSGVYQNVLDGRAGTWWFGSGWCCENPTLLWGGGFWTYPGEVVRFENKLEGERGRVGDDGGTAGNDGGGDG